MNTQTFLFTIFLIFTGAAIFSTVSLFTRQSLLLAYILLGVILGPWGLNFIPDFLITEQIGEVGIIFLLFLLGLHLKPQSLIKILSEVTWIALMSCVVFASIGFSVSYLSGFNFTESLIVGAAMMFSSTIIGLKLLPTSVLRNHQTGKLLIGLLLMQDMIAIIVLVSLNAAHLDGLYFYDITMLILGLPMLILLAFVVERYVLVKLFSRFGHSREYVFLLSIGWCLAMAQFSQLFGLSEEIGAFIAGVALAASPLAAYIAQSLKPLRDFFLVMFFFSVGAGFNFGQWQLIIWPAIILAALILTIKPILFSMLLRWSGEPAAISRETGIRLGQASEFSLLIASLALGGALISDTVAYLIQGVTILSFIVSSYWVVWRYPSNSS